MSILAIDTSCDETSVAITSDRKILANGIYSQILIHKKWGGVVPSLAKRAHEEKIDFVIDEVLRKYQRQQKNYRKEKLGSKNLTEIFKKINYLAITYGPGLAPALEVGIKKTKELAKKYQKKIIPVNHMEGHIYSVFAQNSRGKPKTDFNFPYLCLLVSGGHTELVIFKNHLKYETIGRTIDDAAGEALDKAAKMLGLGYPGGPIIERLAKKGDLNFHKFPRPLVRSNNLNFSFSGLKTSFFYYIKNLKPSERLKNLNNLAACFQESIFDVLIKKLEQAIKKTGIKNVIGAGGVMNNLSLRKRMRELAKKIKGEIMFPQFNYLYGDNAAMIGIAASFKAAGKKWLSNIERLDRFPRLKLDDDESYLFQP